MIQLKKKKDSLKKYSGTVQQKTTKKYLEA